MGLHISNDFQNLINGLIDTRVGEKIVDSSGSNYIKFTDGTMICFGTQEITTTINSTWGHLYASSKITGTNFPVAFNTIKSVNFSCLRGPTFWIGTAETGATLSKTKIPDFYLLSGASQNSTFVIGYTAIGTWK